MDALLHAERDAVESTPRVRYTSWLGWLQASTSMRRRLRGEGVAFGLDLSTPSARLMSQIIGAMAAFERALIQEFRES
jgi:hypothetical protein